MGFKKTTVLIAALITVAVGCGDGKTKKRQPLRNANGANKPVDPKAPSDADRKKAADELAAKGKAEAKIDDQVSNLSSGRIMDKSELPDGKYKLTQFTSSLKYMPATGGWMRALRTQQVLIDQSGDVTLDNKAPTEGTGVSANQPDADGRNIEVASQFTVRKKAAHSARNGPPSAFF